MTPLQPTSTLSTILCPPRPFSSIRLFAVLLAVVFLFGCADKHAAPPNIIFIMSDDHAYQAISAYGSDLISTPQIDRLASEGMRFDRAFVTNSICAPSRAVILTGKHSHLNGVRDNIDVFDSTQQTFPKLLQQAGYETAVIGKWHLKSQPTGFDYWKVLPGQGDYYQPDFLTANGRVSEKGYVTDLITDFSIEWLKDRKDKNRPFLLLCQNKAPHREWFPGPDHLGEFMDEPIPEPKTLFDDYSGRGAAAREAEMKISVHMGFSNDLKIHPDSVEKLGLDEFSKWYKHAYLNGTGRMSPDEKRMWDSVYNPIIDRFMQTLPTGDSLLLWKYQRYLQDYLATIKSVDDNVGRLLDFLQESGLAGNTIVVYTSDQGFYLGEHGWFDKRFMYEESFRTPLIVRWPGHTTKGSVNTDLVQNLDFASTFLEAAGVSVPSDLQGQSLLPLLKGSGDHTRDALYYHYYEYPGIHAVKRHYGIRTDRYKLIHFYHDIDEWELYDLAKDPDELNNVYDVPAYAGTRDTLHLKLSKLMMQYGDSIHVPN